TPLSRASAKAALVFVEKGADAGHAVREAGTAFASAYATLRERDAFTGAAGQVAVLHGPRGSRIETLVLAGVGDKKGGRDALRSAAADGIKAARDAGADRVAV